MSTITQIGTVGADPRIATTNDGIDGWDSVAHVRIIVAIEARFAIRFEPDEYMDFQSVGELIDCLAKQLAPSVSPAIACE